MKPALVLGGASCLEADITQARALIDPAACVVLAVNDAGFWWPNRLDHWVSMHAEEFPERERIRAERGYPDGYTRWTRPYPCGLMYREAFADELFGGWYGSSGLLAVGIAIERLGCDRIMLCGMPMDERAHFNREGAFTAANGYRVGWRRHMIEMADRVRSFSGWTADQLDIPDTGWLTSLTHNP